MKQKPAHARGSRFWAGGCLGRERRWEEGWYRTTQLNGLVFMSDGFWTVSSHPRHFSSCAPTLAILSHPSVEAPVRKRGRWGTHGLWRPPFTSPSLVKHFKERCGELIRQGLALLHLAFACKGVWTAPMWTAALQLWIFSCHRNALSLTLNLYRNGPWWLDS